MVESKFTPGPWGLFVTSNTGLPDNPCECIAIASSDIKPPCSHASVCIITDKESLNLTDCANARLIAAAPDMYGALKELEDSISYWSDYEVTIGIVDRISAAIAKAEGHSEL